MIPYQPDRRPRAARRLRNGPLPVIGLIGGIGAGKSEVARLLKENGATVIDADAVGHDLLTDPVVQRQIVKRFGTGVLSASSDEPGLRASIDRRALGAIVFGDSLARRDLESIVHPRMRASFQAVIDDEQRSGGDPARFIVLDAAILLEAGWDDLCDLIVFVDVSRDRRLDRVEQQRGWSQAAFAAREQAQWPCDQKRRRADLVITNDAGIDGLRREVEKIKSRLAELSCPMIEASN
jgi:dephospho-CoA kinase